MEQACKGKCNLSCWHEIGNLLRNRWRSVIERKCVEGTLRRRTEGDIYVFSVELLLKVL